MSDAGPEVIFLVAVGFVAALADGVVGGGGVISIPALLATGLPPAMALGTNKLASTFTTLTSSFVFHRANTVRPDVVQHLLPYTITFSAFGAFIVTQIPNDFLQPLILFLLILATAHVAVNKNWGVSGQFKQFTKTSLGAASAGIGIISFYDGFLGAGTGLFLILAMLMLGLDFLHAAGNSKVLNLGSNLGALVIFILMESVNFTYGIAVGAGMIGGAIIGSRLAISKGTKYVRLLFVGISVALIVQQLLHHAY